MKDKENTFIQPITCPYCGGYIVASSPPLLDSERIYRPRREFLCNICSRKYSFSIIAPMGDRQVGIPEDNRIRVEIKHEGY